ncbi:MAG: flagellar basal-body MS-ring/collar protein FliF [bacterium]
MDGIKQQLDRLNEWLARFSFNQKVLLGAILVAAVVSVGIFSLWLQHEEKSVLFTNLEPEDAAAALEELTKLDVEADLSNGGTTILVPQSEVYRLRVELAGKGIPASGVVGFEIFDGKQYGLTEFLQNVNFKRALEGELTKSIESLAGITSARVHLVLPKSSIFKQLQTEPTASVVVGLGRAARLSESQINGIQSLVSGSVEGLQLTNVTVIDQNGKVLSRGFADDQVGRSESQLALKKEVEGYLSTKAESMLAEVLGSGRSIVRVDATLNFEKIDRERETFDPEAAVVRSEERTESTDPGSGGTSENSVTNYEINRTVERIVGQTGGVNGLSVAVFVDGTYTADADGGESVYTPLSEEQLNQIQRIVQTAVGLNSGRGDQIEVVNMQFQGEGSPVGQPLGGPGSPVWLELLPEYGGRLLLFLVATILVLSLRKNLGRILTEGLPTRRPPTVADEPPVQTRGKRPSLDLGAGSDTDNMAEDVKEYASENPERVAEMIQAWIADDR